MCWWLIKHGLHACKYLIRGLFVLIRGEGDGHRVVGTLIAEYASCAPLFVDDLLRAMTRQHCEGDGFRGRATMFCGVPAAWQLLVLYEFLALTAVGHSPSACPSAA